MISQVVACCMGGSKHHIGHPGLNTIGLGCCIWDPVYIPRVSSADSENECYVQLHFVNKTPKRVRSYLMFRMWKCSQLVIIWPSCSTNNSDNWLPQLAYLRHCPRAYSYSCKTHCCVKLKTAIPLILWWVELHCCLIRTQANYLCRKCQFQLWGVLVSILLERSLHFVYTCIYGHFLLYRSSHSSILNLCHYKLLAAVTCYPGCVWNSWEQYCTTNVAQSDSTVSNPAVSVVD